MLLREVPKAVGVSRITIYNYRKSLGILEETQEEVPDEIVEKFKKMASAKIKVKKDAKKKETVIKEARQSNNSEGFIEISSEDSTQLKNLKDQYNNNQVLINHLTREINTSILNFETPGKLEMDMMEKYQKLNVTLAKEIAKVNPEEESLSAKISEKLANYS